MRAILQRVSGATLDIDSKPYVRIGQGLVILLGIGTEDDASDIEWLVSKILRMRIFSDDEGKMNLALPDIDGEVLIVSQFTLHASTKKGNRPSFIKAARPEQAIPLYEEFIAKFEATGIGVSTGIFGADMHIHLSNDGPVTIIIDSKTRE